MQPAAGASAGVGAGAAPAARDVERCGPGDGLLDGEDRRPVASGLPPWTRLARVVVAALALGMAGVALAAREDAASPGAPTAAVGPAWGLEAVAAFPADAPPALRKKLVHLGEEASAAVLLGWGRARFSEPAAQAMAAMAKLAYCGPLPGLYASVAYSCSVLLLPNTTTACERAAFSAVPGTVRALAQCERGTEDSLFAFVARVVPAKTWSPVAPGVLLTVRGSVDNFANSYRDMQTRIVSGLDRCEDCGVHQGYLQGYKKLKPQLEAYLQELLCHPEDCTVYVTGHGAGAAIASLAAWDLAHSNYTIGTSYLFEPPRVGNTTFAAEMGGQFNGEGKHGPIFSVTQGKDSAAAWPFNEAFKAWGIEAHYDEVNASRPSQICYAGEEGCGISKYARSQLSSNDMCRSSLAPGHDFCHFEAFVPQCYGGVGFQVAAVLPQVLRGPPQPRPAAAATWHPSEMGVALAGAVARDPWPGHYFSLAALRCAAALAKLSYCGPLLGLPNAFQSTCTAGSGLCKACGFGVVPGSVRFAVAGEEADGAEPLSDATLFAVTALVRRSSVDFAGAPSFVPPESCVLVIRGSTNARNQRMNAAQRQIPLNDTRCPGCTANEGLLTAWKETLGPKVVQALRRSGCEAKASRASVNKVFCVGHSMGGTMCTLALYMLHEEGFEVGLSWNIEGGRPGNPAFMDYLNNRMLAHLRPVPFWLVSYRNDLVPRTGASTFAGGSLGRARFMVHFSSSNLSMAPTLCTSMADYGRHSRCGMYQYGRDELAFGRAHCELPFAPQGHICMFPPQPQCFVGGSIDD